MTRPTLRQPRLLAVGFDSDERPSWYARAECARRGLPTALFFPASTDSQRWDPQVLDACAACPVRVECLGWAVDHGEQGIWAGTDQDARARIRRERRRRTPARRSA